LQQILVQLQCLLKMSGTGFFFAFENEFQIYGKRNIFLAECVDGGEDGDDGGFVVGGRAGVNAPVVLIGICRAAGGVRIRNAFAAGFGRFVPS